MARADPAGEALAAIETMLRRGQFAAAESAAAAFARTWPLNHEGHVLLGRARQKQGNLDGALAAAMAARSLAPGHPAPRMLEVDCLLGQGDIAAGTAALRGLAADAHDQPRVLQDAGQWFTHLGLHAEAEACYARAVDIEPANAAYLYNFATALIARGRLGEAEDMLTRVIRLAPDDGDAYYNRSTLRRQTAAANHVAELEGQLQRPGHKPATRVALGFALAKEREDLGDYAHAFAALKSAADLRRSLLSYRVEDDIATMEQIAAAFGHEFAGQHHEGHADAAPVFIVGLPRSGTTLVDRILSSHSRVESRGETTDLAVSLMQLAGPRQSKAELIRASATLDFAALGARYCARAAQSAAARRIDKTPINFLYLALIAAALPQAHVIHVRRNPMDVCYAMYKTLFRMAYPFSYDLGDLGRYYLAYRQLMAHWRDVLHGRFLEVDYEDLVQNQEAVSRQLVDHVGLEWEDACLHFDRNASPSLTASAAQVRKPMYSSSIGLWRRYASELQPLAAVLRAGGVAIDVPEAT